MVGLDNSWKTTIVLKINIEDMSVTTSIPLICGLGFNIKTITYNKYTLNMWDVGGPKGQSGLTGGTTLSELMV